MDAKLRQVINKTVSEVFETMFFTFLNPLSSKPDETEWDPGRAYIEAVIEYSGPLAGEYLFYIPLRMAKDITVNFLGIDSGEVEDRQIVDTAAEVTNMAVGSLLGKRDPKGECALGIPHAKVLDDFSPASIISEPNVCVFGADNGFLWLVCREK